jgi:DNA-binding CsgD family transcriptional regulator
VGSPRVEARAWHLAGAALGPDEEAAEALEQAAKHARSRSGYAAAAAALERAARLSPDPRVALERLAAAADGAWQAGRTETAGALVAETLARADDPGLRARALRLHGAIEYFAGNADAAARALVEAFELLERSDPSGAVAAAADAVNALVRVRQPAQAVDTAVKARALAPTDGGETDLEATVALGFALCFSGRYGDAEPHLRRAVEIFDGSAAVAGPLQAGRLSAALAWQGRFGVAHAYMTATVGRARAAGAVGTLPHLLAGSAWQALHASRWDEAAADAHEALELAEELGQPVTATQVLGVLTWIHALRGDEGRCRAYGDETRRRARAFGFRLYDLLVSACFGVLDLGAGRVDDAIGHLEEVARYADERGLNIPGVAPQFDLAEACIRAGRAADAETILASFERSELASAPFLGALAARCRGLSAQGDRFEEHFAEALALHTRIESPFALARTQLCYGERLRRARRRAEARTHLRAAQGVFERLGAQPWAARAADELGASGSRVEASAPPALAELTPHELRVASIVASGATNQEVASRLFVTPKTVEYHLRSIYRKLNIRSRSDLTRLYLAEQAAPAPG